MSFILLYSSSSAWISLLSPVSSFLDYEMQNECEKNASEQICKCVYYNNNYEKTGKDITLTGQLNDSNVSRVESISRWSLWNPSNTRLNFDISFATTSNLHSCTKNKYPVELSMQNVRRVGTAYLYIITYHFFFPREYHFAGFCPMKGPL